jgi:hypothetical protein
VRAAILSLLGLAACNAVFGLDPVEEGRDGGDPIVDAVDADPCSIDEFDGETLQSHWSVLAGTAPDLFEVSGGRLVIEDAATAATPSTPGTSWIYDLDSDRGNQLGWPQPIGNGDFVIEADLGWSSTIPELTLGGVGVSDSDGRIIAYAGVLDGSAGDVGMAHASIAVGGAANDLQLNGTVAVNGAVSIRIERTGESGVITLDGAMTLGGLMPGAIDHVSIISVQYQSMIGSEPYGALEVRRLRVCR